MPLKEIISVLREFKCYLRSVDYLNKYFIKKSIVSSFTYSVV